MRRGKFLPWILRIAHNQSIDHFRKNKRNPKITLADGSDIFNCLKFSESREDYETLSKHSIEYIKKLIDALPEKTKTGACNETLYENELQEIAETTNVSINTALGRMRYALLSLRKKN